MRGSQIVTLTLGERRYICILNDQVVGKKLSTIIRDRGMSMELIQKQ